MKLNLGSGGSRLPGYINIDVEPSFNPDIVCNLGTDRWPVDSDSVHEAVASHVLEHLPGEQFFHFIRELHRVMKDKGRIGIVVPHPRHNVFLDDPTHYRAVTPKMLGYFSKQFVDEAAERGEYYTPFYRLHNVNFNIVAVQYHIDGHLPPALLEKVKANIGFYERFMPNTVFEYAITMVAVK